MLSTGEVLLTTVFSYLGVALIRWWAERRRILDIPNKRSSHTQPTPRGGGLAIVVATLVGVWLSHLGVAPAISWTRLAGFIIGAILIAIVSGVDDLHSLPGWLRFGVHSLGAVLAIVSFGYIQTVEVPFLFEWRLGWVGLPLTFLWIVGLTNAYNFMDGIDGLAGSQAVVAGLGWAVWGLWSKSPFVSMLGLLLAASSLGFLGHNWSPARIFMGDVGSAFLGFTYAVLPLLFLFRANNGELVARAPLAALLFLWPFVFDTSFTFVRRALNRENVFAAHRSHLYQRLIISGHSHRTVTCLYIGLALVGVVVALIWVSYTAREWSLAIVTVPLLAVALWLLVKQQEREREKLPQAADRWSPLS